MKTKRALTALAATLLAATAATTAYSPAASAFNTVDCTYNGNNLSSWFNCQASTGANTIWYVGGVRQSAFDGASSASFACSYGHTYRISVNTGTSTAASWFGSCDYDLN